MTSPAILDVEFTTWGVLSQFSKFIPSAISPHYNKLICTGFFCASSGCAAEHIDAYRLAYGCRNCTRVPMVASAWCCLNPRSRHEAGVAMSCEGLFKAAFSFNSRFLLFFLMEFFFFPLVCSIRRQWWNHKLTGFLFEGSRSPMLKNKNENAVKGSELL